MEIADLGEARTVFRCGPLWISSLPGPAEFDLAARRGFAGLIDVREAGEAAPFDLAAAARREGLGYVRLAIDFADPDPAQVARLLEELRRDGERLMFCASAGRAAALFALGRVVNEGLPLEVALAEARRIGMKPGPAEGFVRREAERLAANGAG